MTEFLTFHNNSFNIINNNFSHRESKTQSTIRDVVIILKWKWKRNSKEKVEQKNVNKIQNGISQFRTT